MSYTIIKNAILFIVLILLQAILFNHICVFNVAVPFVFILFILRLPMNINTNLLISLAFFTGLSIDIFSDTQGMNALACTILSVVRKPVLSLYIQREDDMPGTEPSIGGIGMGAFLKYSFTASLIYCILIFIIQAFSFFDIKMMFLRILCSSIITFIVIFGIECLISTRSEKGL